MNYYNALFLERYIVFTFINIVMKFISTFTPDEIFVKEGFSIGEQHTNGINIFIRLSGNGIPDFTMDKNRYDLSVRNKRILSMSEYDQIYQSIGHVSPFVNVIKKRS